MIPQISLEAALTTILAAMLATAADYIQTLVTILVALVVSVVGPYVVAHQLNKARTLEKREDWKRQDVVARRLAEATAHAEKSAREIIVTNKKIHTLVNSNMGMQLKATAFFSRSNFISLKRIAQITKDSADLELASIAEASAIEAEERSLEHEKQQALVDAGEAT